MSYMYGVDTLNVHLADVDLVTSALGVTMNKPYRDLRARWENHDTAESYADQYVAALVTGDTKADLPLLRAMAISIASTLPTHAATIENYAKACVERKLLELYAPESAKIYGLAAQHLNEAVTKFLGCTAIVDVTQPAENLIDATDVVRAAWLNALLASSGIDTAVDVLSAAARLAGHPVTTHEEVLPLIASTAGIHRRVLWTAYESESRCGRWPALSQITEIKAAELPVEPYRRPEPVRTEYRRNERGLNVAVTVDPEDLELAEQKG